MRGVWPGDRRVAGVAEILLEPVPVVGVAKGEGWMMEGVR